MDLYSSLVWFSFFTEFYHSVTHLTVLTGYRMLPRKDLVRARVYFLIDAACAALAFSLHRVSILLLTTLTKRLSLGSVFLSSAYTPAVATHLLLQYMGRQWSCQGLQYFIMMNYNVGSPRESYHGQVLIGTEGGGTSWILFWELLLTCSSIWSTPTSWALSSLLSPSCLGPLGPYSSTTSSYTTPGQLVPQPTTL